MREFFNEAGKINILIAVSLIILAGFSLYLWSISKAVREIEKNANRKRLAQRFYQTVK